MVRRQRTKKRTIGRVAARSRRPRPEEEGMKEHEAARHIAKDHNWGKCMRSSTEKMEKIK